MAIKSCEGKKEGKTPIKIKVKMIGSVLSSSMTEGLRINYDLFIVVVLLHNIFKYITIISR